MRGQGIEEYSRIDKLRKLFLARQQRELDLDDGDLRRPPEEQILQQPGRHRVLERRDVPRGPHACDSAAVRDRPPVRALLRDKQRDFRCEGERRGLCGRRRAEHATREDDLRGRAGFRRRFLRCLLRNYGDHLR